MYKQDRGGLHMARYGIYCLSLWICLSAPMKASSHLFRLFGGSSPCQGTVQIRSQDAWLPVCNGSWSNNLTAVLCRDLRCGKPEAQTGSLQTQPVNQTFLTLTCSDNDSLKNCKISPMESDCPEPVSVYCTGSYDLRLTDGVSRCSGRVEVFLDGVWGSVCNDGWDILDAHVTCQQLGCGSALQALGASYFGPGPSTIHWEDVKCNGTERHLWDCPSSTPHNCTDREHAGVICTGSHLFRLFGGSSPCQGTVQIRSQDAWLPVCNGSWSNNLTAVLCRDLRCGKPEAQTGSLQTQPVNQTFLTLTCSDNDSLKNCKISPMESDCPEPVSVYCTGSYDLRLSDGVSRCSGRVEVFLDGVWGSVCDDGWDALDAHVTCQQLGCGSALQALGASYFGPGPSTIHWEDVKCNGTERHLWDCPSSTRHDCTDREHAGVICTEDKAFRVSGGPHNCSGRIEVLMDGAWGTVCDSQWFEEDFQMFCKLLGCGPYVRKTIYNHSLSTYMGIICTNTASLLDCRVYHKNNNICQQAGALGVICGSFYNTEKEAGQAVSPVNPGFPLLAMMICVTLAALLLVAVITFSLVIWRMKRLQRVSLQITSLTPTNGYREATLRPPKTPVPASIPVVPVVIEPQSDSDDCEFNGCAPPAPFMTFQVSTHNPVAHHVTDPLDDSDDYDLPSTPPMPLLLCPDSSRKEPEQNRHQEEHQQEKPARKESYRASKSTSSTSSEEDNWYENYKGRHQELLEVLHSHSSFTSSAEYDDVVSEHSI